MVAVATRSQGRRTSSSPSAEITTVVLASERFGPRPLVVKGTEEFCRQIAVLAGQKELVVTFADPKLEAHRAIAAFERSKADEHGHGVEDGLGF
jgi:hypothetical protein